MCVVEGEQGRRIALQFTIDIPILSQTTIKWYYTTSHIMYES